MISPSKKKLYIIVIAVCALGVIAILIWSRSASNSSLTPADFVTNIPASNSSPTASGGLKVPVVFPGDTKFDTSVLDSANFKKLEGYENLRLEPSELGKDNPFKK